MSLYWGTMHLITDRLLVGTIDDAREPPAVIGTLLLVAEEFTIEPAAWVDYRRIPITEFAEADPGTLLQAIEWLEQRVPESRALVCCRAGMSRSVSVVMAYLCCVEGMTFADVLNLVMARRPGAMPLPNLQSAVEQVRLLRLAA
jgi:protein-tyrosine phosphatase